jgi:hypothetical protein
MLSERDLQHLVAGREAGSELDILRRLEMCLRDGKEQILMETRKSNCGCSPDKLVFRNPHCFLINGYLEQLDEIRKLS